MKGLYTNLAKYYDLIYSWKDYKKEAAEVRKLIQKYKKSPGKNLVSVACGTGKHVSYLKRSYRCEGNDLNEAMVREARKKVKGVSFKRANMITLNLGKKYDVLLCLFSSIGYVKTYANLQKTIKRFAQHLKPGGVVIIEPWLTKQEFKPGLPHMQTYADKNVKVCRQNVSKVKGNLSVLDFHFLISEKNSDVQYVLDRHELGMFDHQKMVSMMTNAGLNAKLIRNKMFKRNLLIGVKPLAKK